jgi:RNA polymerase sigma factor (sigma-70 family)
MSDILIDRATLHYSYRAGLVLGPGQEDDCGTVIEQGAHLTRDRRRSARMGEESSSGAFARVYDENIWGVYGYLAYRVSSRADAEDLTQLTFERALKAWDRFDSRRASVATWLLAIARNLLVDHYRRDHSQHQEPIGVDGSNDAALGHLELEPNGVSPELAAALEQLSRRDREIVALRFGGDLTGPEIADLTGLSLANVQQILSRSLRRLRVELERPAPLARHVRA